MLKKIYTQIIVTFISILMFVSVVFANPIDDSCKQFVNGTAPVVTVQTHVDYKCMKRYAVAYDTSALTPIYGVTYVTKDELDGDVVRRNDFHQIPDMVTAKKSDFTGTKYDLGHIIEADLFTTDSDAMDESFCMCNIHAQWFSFNRGIWHSLEIYSHKLVKQYGSAYIITGTAYTKQSPTIGRGVTIVDYTWKIISIPSAHFLEAYMIPNKDHAHERYTQYRVTVRDIEIATGLKIQ